MTDKKEIIKEGCGKKWTYSNKEQGIYERYLCSNKTNQKGTYCLMLCKECKAKLEGYKLAEEKSVKKIEMLKEEILECKKIDQQGDKTVHFYYWEGTEFVLYNLDKIFGEEN